MLNNLAGKKVCVFTSSNDNVNSLELPVFHNVDCYVFDGILVCLSIWDLKQAVKYPLVTEVYYYVHELEWVYSFYDAKEVLEILMDKKVKVIAISKEYGEIFEKTFKKVDGIAENFNYDQIIETVRL